MATDRVKRKAASASGVDKAPDAASRRGYSRPVADSLRKLTKSIFARQGFAEANVVTRWREIVGPGLADHCLPERLTFSRDAALGENPPGTLHVVASGAFATELQHLSPQLIDRINGYFGFPAVARLTIRQAPVGLIRPNRRKTARPLTQKEKDALQELTEGVRTPELKTALNRLGEAVLTKGG